MLETHADQMTVIHGTYTLTKVVEVWGTSSLKGAKCPVLLWKYNRSVNHSVFCTLLSATHAACWPSWDPFKPCLSINHHYCLHDTSSYFLSPGVTWNVVINSGKLPNFLTCLKLSSQYSALQLPARGHSFLNNLSTTTFRTFHHWRCT